MPLYYVKDDVSHFQADAVVRMTNKRLSGENGTNDAICHAAGDELLRDPVFISINTNASGTSVITKGYSLPAKHIIHTVIPVYTDGNHDEEKNLRRCCRNALQLALEHHLESLAFPQLSSDLTGYPKNLLEDAVKDEIQQFLLSDHPDIDITLILSDGSNSMLGKDRFLDLLIQTSGKTPKGHPDNEKTGIYARIRNILSYRTAERRKLKKALKQIENEELLHQTEPESQTNPNRRKTGKKEIFDHTGELPVITEHKKTDAVTDHREQYSSQNNYAGNENKPKQDVAHSLSDNFFGDFQDHRAGAIPQAPVLEMLKPVQAKWSPQEEMRPSPSFDSQDGTPHINHAQISLPSYSRVNLEELRRQLKALDESFTDMLLRKIDERGISDVECYKKANIDRKLFSKIRSNRYYMPKKTTVFAFAIALKLSLPETEELLKKAGYALSGSNKTDIIIRYYIEHNNYNIFDINEALYEFSQNLLGA